ncbi:MAG: hypothetical protein OXF96_09870, partial [Chloroflexi bacterium]|nr:hypothetical protein [Chloroflexota bacterium]
IRGMSLANGVEVANAPRAPVEATQPSPERESLRYAMPNLSPAVADYVRDHTPIDARVFTSLKNAWAVSVHTGRPNASGFVGHAYHTYHPGPEHLDVLGYLEPSAVRRLGIEYVHATDSWVATLPQRAQAWLEDPRLFEPVVRDEHQALYRVRRAFSSLDVAPNPTTFEALRQAVPPSATVYLVTPPRDHDTLLVGAALSHARLVGELDPLFLHVIPPARWQVDRLTDEAPDLVVIPTDAGAWMFGPSARAPIWWHDDVAVYAPAGAVPRLMNTPVPTGPPSVEPPVLVELTDVTVADGRIEFRASFDERASQGWTSQDWVVLEGDRSPWAIPMEVFRQGREPTIAAWFAGLLSAGSATTAHVYQFDARMSELSVRNDQGDFVPLASSAAKFGPGGYTLALRLRHEHQPNHWRDAAVIPVLRTRVSETGDVSYEILEDVLDGMRLP